MFVFDVMNKCEFVGVVVTDLVVVAAEVAL